MPKVDISITWKGGKPTATPDNAPLKADNDWAEWTSSSNFTITFPDGIDAPVTHHTGGQYVAKSKVFPVTDKGKHNYDISIVNAAGQQVVVDPSIEIEG